MTRFTWSVLGALAAAVGLLSADGAWAQGAGASGPYVGVVNVDKVEVRSGAGRAYYAVGELQRGARVNVVSEFFDWYKIEAPSGVFSYVLQKDVDRKGDGASGVVNSDRVDVNVADPQRGADRSFRTHKVLNRGDTVTILGTETDPQGRAWFRIAPPADAYVFLPPNTVEPAPAGAAPARPVVDQPTPPVAWEGGMEPVAVPDDATGAATDGTPETAADTGDMTPANADSAAPTAGADATATAAASTPPTNEEPLTLNVPEGFGEAAVATATDADPTEAAPETTAADTDLRSVEQANLAKFEMPVDEQPLDEMRAAYEAVAARDDLSPADRRIVEQRLAVIARNADVAATLARLERLRTQLPEYDAEQIEVPPDPADAYVAVGTLSASTVFTGDRAPRMFRVSDPVTRRTVAYVRGAPGVDLAPQLGQLVGIKGSRQFDPSLNASLITATSVDVLTAQ